jgi:hypothetical protein
MATFIPLDAAVTFAVLAGTGITFTAPINTLIGDAGSDPTNTVTGAPANVTQTGTLYTSSNSAVIAAKTSLQAAYTNAGAQITAGATTIGPVLDGLTLAPGKYIIGAGSLSDNAILTLNASSSSDVWIFQATSSLTIGNNSRVEFSGSGGCSGRVYWQVVTSATLGTGSVTIGNILANTSISTTNTADVNGRLLAINGAVTLIGTTVDNSVALACTGGDPHVVCLDGSRIDVYDPGFYRLFDTGSLTDRIIINADIQRNSVGMDAYNQLWIKTKTDELTVNFRPEGIVVSTENESAPVSSWSHSYLSAENIYYTLTCESQYNTVCLSLTESEHQQLYSGLVAGQILPLKDLKDQQSGHHRLIQPNLYTKNALLAGSSYPHVVTAQKKSIHPTSMWCRLLQWETNGVINVRLDSTGQMRELILCSNQGGKLAIESWEWTGQDFCNFSTFRNQIPLDTQHVQESRFTLNDQKSTILLRIQGNGSVSAGFSGKTESVRGLLFGDIQLLTGPYDLKFYNFVDPIDQCLVMPRGLSLYQRLIEPMA